LIFKEVAIEKGVSKTQGKTMTQMDFDDSQLPIGEPIVTFKAMGLI
jgi:hypothetical protein